jgi:hypothetical protein
MEMSDDYSLCPRCGRTDGYLNIKSEHGAEHWFFCREHKTRWHVGSNLSHLCPWIDNRAQYEAMDFGSYEIVVKPFHLPRANNGTPPEDPDLVW